ncbi:MULTISPECIES: OB-fold domain-containing protein [Halococcus]|uniref:ChsH2 C-terminal OB-fold domain-containing protein n=1 Tax=Halococcus salifodinae DSM 8989 TaxID=1227456 RepID=M0N027_9EURY|nr:MULTISPECIES: OB-fold domain-containing protein [Halococcus]EMA50439.1 hypothetical protein C450_15123 [Halococcus salifodinae DSM 8989]
MSHENDGAPDRDADAGETPPMEATRYADGSITYPGHTIGPGGAEPVETVDLSEHTATVVTWTTSTAPPPGVDAPNHLAIVAFDIDGETVRALGQVTTDEIAIGDDVTPVYAAELRNPEAGIREPESQDWDGYRFEPV